MTQRDIVLLTVDSLRYDAVFSNGNHSKLSGFREVADDAVVYHDAYATGSNTVDSFPALLSGYYQWRFSDSRKGFEQQRPHIAEVLQNNGYVTSAFHSNPYLKDVFGYNRGFDHFFTGGFESEEQERFSSIQQKVTQYKSLEIVARKTADVFGRLLGVDIRGKPYIPAPILHARAEKWLRDSMSPRFLWIHYMDVHNPWYPHPGTESENLEKRKLIRLFYKARDRPDKITEKEWKKLKRGYEGAVQQFDQHLATFLETLSELANDPIIILTSDHGELFGEDGLALHPPVVHPKLLHIPLFIKNSKHKTLNTSPVSTVDIAPTIAELADVGYPDCDGQSLVESENNSRTVYAQSGDVQSGMIREISSDSSQSWDIETEWDQLPDRVRKHIRDMRASQNSSSTFDESKVKAQLEALGYK